MTAIPQSAFNASVTQQLATPLRQVARRRWLIGGAIAGCKTFAASLVILLAAVLALGLLENLWMPVRLMFSITIWSLIGGLIVRTMAPALGRWSLKRAAWQAEMDHPELQERLSSAIELASQSHASTNGSPALLEHLFEQARADAGSIAPHQIVPSDRLMRWAFLPLPVLATWVTLAMVPATSHATFAGLYRMVKPWTSTLPAALIQIKVTPGDVTLAADESMNVQAAITFDLGTEQPALLSKVPGGTVTTTLMQHVDGHNYSGTLQHLQQSVAYQISTARGESTWFLATVHQRPQITDLNVRCEYPAYTAQAPTISNDRDGAIQALVGTHVTLTLHTQDTVDWPRCNVVVHTQGGADVLSPLIKLQSDTDYQSNFDISASGSYQIHLLNKFGLTNLDDQPHVITAIPDRPPTIIILSPDQNVTVGLNDVVPIKYIARDDFGIAHIEAALQIDDQPERKVTVPFTATEKTLAQSPPVLLSIAELLKAEGLTNASTITYQLTVTDNRQGDPQVGRSNKQVLKITAAESQIFQDRHEKQAADNLIIAMQAAVRQLNQSQQKVQTTRDVDSKQSLEAWRRKQLDEAAQELPNTSKALSSAAREASDSPFKKIAQEVQEIVDNPMRSAADDTAQADLNYDKGQDRQEAASRAVSEIGIARMQLEKLLDSHAVEKQLHQVQAVRELAEAAKSQQDAAELMKSPAELNQRSPGHQSQQKQQQRQALRKQEEARQQLEKAMQLSEALRDPQSQETARQLQDLIHKVDETQKHQEAAAEQTRAQQATENVQQDVNTIAREQEAVNQAIEKTVRDNKSAMQNASVDSPLPDQQRHIVEALNQDRLNDAHNQMQQTVNQLRQATQRLQQVKSSQLDAGTAEQERLTQDQHTQEQAHVLQGAAQQAAEGLKPPKGAQDDPQTAAVTSTATTEAKHAAEQIEAAATEMQHGPDASKPDVDNAQKRAEAAAHAADNAAHATDLTEAQHLREQAAAELRQAATSLVAAAKHQSDAHQAAMVADQQKKAQDAATQVQQLAKRQDTLAQAVAAQQTALAKLAHPPSVEQTASQQNDVVQQTREAKKQAEQLEVQAKQVNNPGAAKRAKQAETELAAAQEHAARAAQAQQQAAQDQQRAAEARSAQEAATAQQNASQARAQAAAQQGEAQQALASAAAQLRAMPANSAAQDGPASNATSQQSAERAAQAAQEAAQAQHEAAQQNPAAAKQAASALAQAAHQLAQATGGTRPGLAEEGQSLPGEKAMTPSSTPGQTSEPSEGIKLANLPIALPTSVSDLGISADQWAVLPPLVKNDLINAAQQTGPPAYRQMMRDYFTRLASMNQLTGAGEK